MATVLGSTSPVQSFSIETLDRSSEVRSIFQSGDPSARICPWCNQEITEDQTVYPLGGRLLHDGDGAPECRAEFDSFTTCTREG